MYAVCEEGRRPENGESMSMLSKSRRREPVWPREPKEQMEWGSSEHNVIEPQDKEAGVPAGVNVSQAQCVSWKNRN